MHSKIYKTLKDYTRCMFSEEWYDNLTDLINEAISEESNVGHVYFIKSRITGLYKIGVSTSLQKRLRTIQQNVGKIYICGIIMSEEYKSIEKKIHSDLKSLRVYGEWFDIDSSSSKYNASGIMQTYGFSVIEKNYMDTINFESYDMSFKGKIEIPEDLLEYFRNININSDSIFDKKKIYTESGLTKIYSQRKFTDWFSKYLDGKGFNYIESRSSKRRCFKIV